MPQKTSPFIEAKYGWNLGESGWNTGMDENLLKFSYLFDANVDSVVNSLPAPASGKAYFLTTDNNIYFCVDGTYYPVSLPKWFQFKIRNTGVTYIFDGSTASILPSSFDVSSQINTINSKLLTKADVSSPVFTGTPRVPDVAPGTSSGQAVNAKFVIDSLVSKADASSLSPYAKLLSPDFSGTVLVPNVDVSAETRQVANVSSVHSILGSRSVRVVNNVAQALGLDLNRYKYVQTLGYYSAGDGGANLFYVDIADSTSVSNGGTILGSGTGRLKAVDNTVITTKQFGCRADGATDDYTALTNWFNAGLATRAEMVISDGIHKINTATTWDFAPVATLGLTIRGSNPNHCILDFTSVPSGQGTPFQWIGSNSAALFYLVFSKFNIRTNFAGVGFRIGTDALGDAFNSCIFDKITVNNSSQTQANEACRINYVLQSRIDIVANAGGTGRPGTATVPGYGTALVIRQACFNYFVVAAGNANKGIYMTGGFNYGNTFFATDVEEVTYVLLIDNSTTLRNNFVNGTFVGVYTWNCTAGTGNVIDNPNVQLYSGGTENVNVTGLWIKKPQQYNLATPSMPASGAGYTNTTGRQVVININGGTVTAISVTPYGGGAAQGLPIGTWYGYCVILNPGEVITLTYSATPSWIWRPVQ